MTRFAVLTPPGTSAVATIAVTGPRAWTVVRQLFRPAGSRPLSDDSNPECLSFGHFGPPPGDAVVLAVRSCGDKPSIELHCHGGNEVVGFIAAELERVGAQAASAEQLSVGRLADVRAAAELARAPTLRTANVLLDQAWGAFRRTIDSAVAAADAGYVTHARTLLGNLARHAAVGRHLTRPWRVAVTGAPNVGKSSLVNAIAGFQRTVVTPTPGTTRDAVAVSTAIDGWPVELIDTAGQRTTADELEGQGIARALAELVVADLCLWVVAHDAPPALPEPSPANCLVVVNKSDIPAVWDAATVPNHLSVSARTGDGMAGLCERISLALVPAPPVAGAAVPFTPELADRVTAIAEAAPAEFQPLLRSLHTA